MMNKVKQDLYETLLEEFYLNPTFSMARTIFLFCQDNMEFPLPLDVEKIFVDGVRALEVRGFGLTVRTQPKAGNDGALKKDILKKIIRDARDDSEHARQQRLLRILSDGTGKTYTPQMMKKITSRCKGALSYNDILEIFLLAEHRET